MMSRIIYILIALSLLISLPLSAQNSAENEGMRNNIDQHILYADKDSNRGNYYLAIGTLEKALEWAKDIDDQKSIGIIHTNMAKLYYTLEDFDQAISNLAKATEIQRNIDRVGG